MYQSLNSLSVGWPCSSCVSAATSFYPSPLIPVALDDFPLRLGRRHPLKKRHAHGPAGLAACKEATYFVRRGCMRPHLLMTEVVEDLSNRCDVRPRCCPLNGRDRIGGVA